MNFKVLQYEIKKNEGDGWIMISEVKALKSLEDSFLKITPIIAEMLQGKEIIMPEGILRIKKSIK